MLNKPARNNRLLDTWSFAHLMSGIVFGWLMNPFLAMLLLIAWEPLEIFILAPVFAKFGITFGHETLRNSLSDIVVDLVGVILGATILTMLIAPPFFIN